MDPDAQLRFSRRQLHSDLDPVHLPSDTQDQAGDGCVPIPHSHLMALRLTGTLHLKSLSRAAWQGSKVQDLENLHPNTDNWLTSSTGTRVSPQPGSRPGVAQVPILTISCLSTSG